MECVCHPSLGLFVWEKAVYNELGNWIVWLRNTHLIENSWWCQSWNCAFCLYNRDSLLTWAVSTKAEATPLVSSFSHTYRLSSIGYALKRTCPLFKQQLCRKIASFATAPRKSRRISCFITLISVALYSEACRCARWIRQWRSDLSLCYAIWCNDWWYATLTLFASFRSNI